MILNQTGGVNLNFAIKNYASESDFPAVARENTIGVITTVPVTAYAISASQPSSPKEGMLWILAGPVGGASLAVTAKNPIVVYPGSTRQYVDGAWVTKTARIYQGGEWKPWLMTLIPDPAYSASAWSKSNLSITNQNASMLFQCSSMYGTQTAYGLKAVDVTAYSTMKIQCTFTQDTGNGNTTHFRVGLFSSMSANALVSGAYKTSNTNGQEISVNTSYDVSNLTGKYYFGFVYHTNSGNTAVDYHGKCLISRATLS